jgi:hypothetical protein
MVTRLNILLPRVESLLILTARFSSYSLEYIPVALVGIPKCENVKRAKPIHLHKAILFYGTHNKDICSNYVLLKSQ